MNHGSQTHVRPQHAWFEVSRSAPPKRAAAERVGDFLDIYRCYDEDTAQEQASRCLQCPEPMCVTGCPVGSRIPEGMSLTAEGQFIEAAAICRSANNMPEVCSRVCPQDRLCEAACILQGRSDAVSIGAIERFINEYAFARGAVDANPVSPNGLRVAVIGAGPVGMACADELAKRGYGVTVFEAKMVPGGLLIDGIPAFKLERSVVERRIDLLKKRGVVFRVGVKIGKDITLNELRTGFDAVFLGFGAQRARRMEIPGADLKGVTLALPFILQTNTEAPLDIPSSAIYGKRVVVLGAGDTAMDCLRSAIRAHAGAAVCVYRRDEENMPAVRREYENAVEEGAEFVFHAVPVALLGDQQGRVSLVRCQRTELGAKDVTGRRPPIPIPGTEFDVAADLVVAAFGFEPSPLARMSDLSQLATNESGGVVVDGRQMTNLNGVFAGGDMVRGPSLVVHAVRDARKAAQEIHRFLFAQRVNDLGLSQADHFAPEAY